MTEAVKFPYTKLSEDFKGRVWMTSMVFLWCILSVLELNRPCLPHDGHCMRKDTMNILKTFLVRCETESHAGFERREVEEMMIEFSFFGELIL